MPVAPYARRDAGETSFPAGPHRPTPPDRAAEGTAERGGAPRPPLLSAETQVAAQQAPQDSQQHPEKSGQSSTKPTGSDPSNPENLSEEERKKVQELQKADREVRAHEQAHKAAGGAHAGSPTFKTVRGPDGKSYAVSGEVKIDTSPVANNPDATIRKLEQVKRAALAPANPSGQDRRVAAEAEAKIQAARQEKREAEAEELKKANEKNGGQASGPAASSVGDAKDALTPEISGGPASGAGKTASLGPGSLLNLVA